jgi:MFS transporter, ACS family, hexuronate transporter
MTPQASVGPSRTRWLMIAMVFLATVVNYLDRQTLSVVGPFLREQFHMNNTDYSRVVSAFMLAYTISNGVSGPLIDRLGTKLGYALCMAWWSVAAILHALSRGTLSLGVYRFLLGIGEAGNWPAGIKVVAEWFPVEERALASGIFNSGSSIGAIISAPLVAWIVLSFGWQASFYMVGATGLLWLAAWFAIYYTPAQVQQEVAAKPIPALRLLRTRWVWSFTVSKIFSDPVWYFYIFWFPQYLRSDRGFDLASIGKWAWIPFVTAGAGNLFGGWASEWMLRRGVSVHRAKKICVWLFAALMMSAIPAVLTPNVVLSIALISLATMGYTGALANMLSMPADVFPKNAVGSIWGLASMGAGFGGMVFSLITGWVVDHYSYIPVFFGFGLIPLIAAAIVWTLPEQVTGLEDAS